MGADPCAHFAVDLPLLTRRFPRADARFGSTP